MRGVREKEKEPWIAMGVGGYRGGRKKSTGEWRRGLRERVSSRETHVSGRLKLTSNNPAVICLMALAVVPYSPRDDCTEMAVSNYRYEAQTGNISYALGCRVTL